MILLRLAAVAALLATGLLGLVSPVFAHAGLVASTPGAGQRLATAPPELRLVFSEPLDPAYSSADLLASDGASVATRIGRPDEADAHVLVAPLPALPDGVYTVVWRSLSAADGHADSGAFSFGVGPGGAVGSGAGGESATAGAGENGHGHGGSSDSEVQATFLLDAGVLLAFGLVVISWVVLDPASGFGRGAIAGAAVALLVAAAGAALVILAAAAGASADPGQYALRTRPGLLLLVRAGLGLAGGTAVLALARWNRPSAASDVAMFAAAAVLALTALSGHAAAFSSPGPILADAVHLGAAGTWLAGLAVLASLATLGRAGRDELRAMVPRFSALALVAVALIALTGLYAAWIETRDFTAFDDPYVRLLAIKTVVALAAFGIGSANYLTDPAGTRLGGLGRRVGLEAGLAIVVVVVTAALATGAPASGGRPTPIAGATTTADSVAFAIAPGRPGPNRFVVRLGGDVRAAAGATGASVSLGLDRLDGPAAPVAQPLAASGPAGEYAADVGGLPGDSRWNATVEVRRPDGTVAARGRFEFGFDAVALSEGRATPPIDPAVVAALLLAALGLLATVFAVAGGRPPRVEGRTGRLALLVGGPIAVLLGVVILALPPVG